VRAVQTGGGAGYTDNGAEKRPRWGDAVSMQTHDVHLTSPRVADLERGVRAPGSSWTEREFDALSGRHGETGLSS
jgi:hypothetical protein